MRSTPGSKKPLLHYYDTSQPVSPERSHTMSRIRGKDTKPEMVLRRAMHAAGLRYRVHDKSLPGRPDISNKSRRIAIFVDGCFWHGCPRHFRPPKTRTEFWTEKIRRNKEKRQEILAQYSKPWSIIQLYECEIQDGMGPDQVLRAWRR